ncbi:coiled-coil domain-containing protein [Nonomuraea endophytica]|uniref:Molybdopterin converting factor small subunit n=1 Tax=Nonomuraea endophytica TaxID=714136 RepID=A0A7W8A481_9ACTN|nr:hypothetical protein [Nonomuraea endophytica]MBB5078545.1 molybdopterin converting factor small subunit [Nonomuraea endophytica]
MAVASPAGVRRGPLWRKLAALAAALALAVAPIPASAKPKPTVKQLKRELAALQKESDKLITDYYSTRVELQKVDKTEKAARERFKGAQAVYDREATNLRLMGTTQYISGEPNLANMFSGGGDPESLLNRLALNRHMVDVQNARLRGFAQVRDELQRAQEESAAQEEELRATVEDLEDRKKKAEKLIAKMRDKIEQLHDVPGARRDGTFVPQLPAGEDNITPRMRLVKQLVQERFEVPFGIGCYRSIRDGGEHPLGRACDFMLSRGGAMPSAAEIARGNEICAWVVKNAKRLGIMYVIYRQRIWHVRNGQWRTMTDRGGTTANHYDHPHISVY